jgi:hypothetical protein
MYVGFPSVGLAQVQTSLYVVGARASGLVARIVLGRMPKHKKRAIPNHCLPGPCQRDETHTRTHVQKEGEELHVWVYVGVCIRAKYGKIKEQQKKHSNRRLSSPIHTHSGFLGGEDRQRLSKGQKRRKKANSDLVR